MSQILKQVEGLTAVQQRAVLSVVQTVDPYVHAAIEAGRQQLKGLDGLTDNEVIRLVGSVLVALHADNAEALIEAESNKLMKQVQSEGTTPYARDHYSEPSTIGGVGLQGPIPKVKDRGN